MVSRVDWAAKRRKAGSKFVRQSLATASNPSVGNMALLAYRGVKGLRALINSEEFVFDTAYNVTLAANTAVITPLNNIAQGDGQSQRTGNSILMKKLMRMQYNTTAVANTLVREILFIDKQQVADTAPVVGDILESSLPIAALLKTTSGRFQILEDNLYTLNSASTTGRVFRKSRMLHKHAFFNGTASTDIQKNGLYKLAISDTVCALTGMYRLVYHDN